jgi:elongation factor P--(R)-beta-lysine ligase
VTSEHSPAASIDLLEARASLLARVRDFFTRRQFIEVETPILSADIVVDRHLDPLTTILYGDPRAPERGPTMYLQTSPEFGMKRLLAAGMTAIYQITRAFRAGEVGPLHNPEFTMVEWYRVGDEYAAGRQLLVDFFEHFYQSGVARERSYVDVFQEHVGVDAHRGSVDELANAAKAHGVVAPDSLGEDRDAWLELLFSQLVQPKLGRPGATIIYDYPATQAALAKVREGNPPVAERFEMFYQGVELANGYHELTDPAALRARNRSKNAARARDGKKALPEESRLLTAMDAGLPAGCGVALGFDRAVMLAAGAKCIQDVMAFTVERA